MRTHTQTRGSQSTMWAIICQQLLSDVLAGGFQAGVFLVLFVFFSLPSLTPARSVPRLFCVRLLATRLPDFGHISRLRRNVAVLCQTLDHFEASVEAGVEGAAAAPGVAVSPFATDVDKRL